jgi:hypothetical protein
MLVYCKKCNEEQEGTPGSPCPACQSMLMPRGGKIGLFGGGPPKPSAMAVIPGPPKPKAPVGIDRVSDALRLRKVPRPQDPPWTREQGNRNMKGIGLKTQRAREHLAQRPYDQGSSMLAVYRYLARRSDPVNDSPLYLKNMSFRHTNCAMCTLAAIEGKDSTATRVVLRRQDALGLFLDPSVHDESMWLKTQEAAKQEGLGRKKIPGVAPLLPRDPWRANRMSTTAQLEGMIEYLRYVAEQSSVECLVVRQGFPDLQPDDRRLFGLGAPGDPLGEMYPTRDKGRGTLLGLMNAYPNGTRFAVFLFGGGRGVGAMHWVYAERYLGKVVFEDYQKNLYIAEDDDAWPPTAYLDEIPHHPITNAAKAFSRGMFLAIVPAFESAKKTRASLRAAVGKHDVGAPQFHDEGPIEWPPLEVHDAKAELTDAMITAINELIPQMFRRLNVKRAPVRLERNRTVFELEAQEMGLAIMYMENAEGLMSEGQRRDLLPVLERGYRAHSGEELPIGTDKKSQIQALLERLWPQQQLRTNVIQYLKNNGAGGYWTADKLYPGKCGANIAYPGTKAAFLWKEYTVTQDMYYYTVVHEFMHLQAGAPNGMRSWRWRTVEHLANAAYFSTESTKDALRATFDEGLTDLFAELLMYMLNKHTAFRSVKLRPPIRQGYRTYDYQRRGMYLAARRIETTHTKPGLLHTYVGIKAFARALFDKKYEWLHASIKEDDARLHQSFLRPLSQLGLEASGYVNETSPARRAVTELGLPTPAKLSPENDMATQFVPYFWGSSWAERVPLY